MLEYYEYNTKDILCYTITLALYTIIKRFSVLLQQCTPSMECSERSEC